MATLSLFWNPEPSHHHSPFHHFTKRATILNSFSPSHLALKTICQHSRNRTYQKFISTFMCIWILYAIVCFAWRLQMILIVWLLTWLIVKSKSKLLFVFTNCGVVFGICYWINFTSLWFKVGTWNLGAKRQVGNVGRYNGWDGYWLEIASNQIVDENTWNYCYKVTTLKTFFTCTLQFSTQILKVWVQKFVAQAQFLLFQYSSINWD